jgi:acyl carrier protein
MEEPMIDTKQDLRLALRAWLLERSPSLVRAEFRDTTPLIERGILSSLQVVELLLWIEQVTGQPVDMAALVPGSFRDVNSICERFLEVER